MPFWNNIVTIILIHFVAKATAFSVIIGQRNLSHSSNIITSSLLLESGRLDDQALVDDGTEQSLLSLALNLDPEWRQESFDFIDPLIPSRSIPCNVALVVEMDDIHYIIGTPVHTVVAVLCEQIHDKTQESSSFFIDPDDDNNLEILEMAVSAFYKTFGKDTGIQFERCPRALTVTEGDLSIITGFNSNVSNSNRNNFEDAIQKLMNDSSHMDTTTADEEEYLDSFFRRELGDNYMQYLQSSRDDLDRAKMVEHLFQMPGKGGITSMEERAYHDKLLSDVLLANDPEIMIDSDTPNDDEIKTALRLVSCEGPDGQMYWLTQLIQPMILVAKEVDDDQKYLLTREDAQQIVPKLELILKKQFQKMITQ